MNRNEFPRKVRAALESRAAGHCEECGAVLKPGEGEADHILPDALGGRPTLDNATRPRPPRMSVASARRIASATSQPARSARKAGFNRAGFPPRERRGSPSGICRHGRYSGASNGYDRIGTMRLVRLARCEGSEAVCGGSQPLENGRIGGRKTRQS